MIKVAISGFGRIGRIGFRAALERYADKIEVVAINTSGSMDVAGWAHLLKYDTVYGKFKREVGAMGGDEGELGVLTVDGKRYPVLARKDPVKIPWSKYNTDVVLEATGAFRRSKECEGHLAAGAKKVIISAPPEDDTPIYIIGVNADQYGGEKIISNGSCTTNCVAPILKIMKENFSLGRVAMTTIHAYTADQELVDGSHKDPRRARAAAQNIIPTTTGAVEAVGKIFPDLVADFSGLSIRVPVACGSLADFSFVLDRSVRAEKVNRLFDQAAAGEYAGIVGATSEPLVSSDIIGAIESAIIDLSLTSVTGQNLVKIIAWYDNEYAYACRLLEMAVLVGAKL